MNKHLSAEQLSSWLIDEGTGGEERHLRDCRECSADLARMQRALSFFRNSVHGWAESASMSQADARVPARARIRLPWQPLAWGAVAAMLLLLAMTPVYTNTTPAAKAAGSIEDAVLLDRINAQLSRTVPASMEPLMDLMESSTVERQGEK